MNKNDLIEKYIIEKVNQTNKQYPGLINNDTLTKGIVMFNNDPDDLEVIKSKINNLIDDMIDRYEQIIDISKQKHYELNEFFDCRISNETLHIHVVPKSIEEDMKKRKLNITKYVQYVNSSLDDALIKIVSILSENDNKNINKIFAVSPTLKSKIAQQIFVSKGFAEIKKSESELFRNIFKTEEVYETQMTKLDLLKRYETDKFII